MYHRCKQLHAVNQSEIMVGGMTFKEVIEIQCKNPLQYQSYTIYSFFEMWDWKQFDVKNWSFFFLRIYSLMFSCHYVMGGQFIWIAFDVGAYSLTQEDQTRATINSDRKSVV